MIGGDYKGGINETDYLEKRREKEQFFRDNPQFPFIGIEFSDCYTDSKILEILRKHISPSLEIVKDNTVGIRRRSDELERELTLKEAKAVSVDGHLPAVDKISCSLRKRIEKHWGSIPKYREEHEDYENFKKQHASSIHCVRCMVDRVGGVYRRLCHCKE